MRIHYFAAINLLGFKQTVDAIGGVDITVARTINDPTYYDEFDRPDPLYIKAGTYHMNGHMALAFVRSRKGVGDSDFTRADRQQQLLEAMRAKLTAGNLLPRPPRAARRGQEHDRHRCPVRAPGRAGRAPCREPTCPSCSGSCSSHPST